MTCRCGEDHRPPPCDYPWCRDPAVVQTEAGYRACASCAGLDVGFVTSDLFVGLTEDGEVGSGFVVWRDAPIVLNPFKEKKR